MSDENSEYHLNVFVNCPFDDEYKELFNPLVFTIFDCGFIVRCTLEEADASQVRIDKIYKIINESMYGIHDISRTEPIGSSGLPRFNMPLELGIFLGAKKYGDSEQKRKNCLILDIDRYNYQKFISDIAGQDINAHKNDPRTLVRKVRDWLRNASGRVTIPSSSIIWGRYQTFLDELPELCNAANFDLKELIFNDFSILITEWLKEQESHFE